jgi:hypothetical protein
MRTAVVDAVGLLRGVEPASNISMMTIDLCSVIKPNQRNQMARGGKRAGAGRKMSGASNEEG